MWNFLDGEAPALQDDQALTQTFRAAFLAIVSETPDNLQCVSRIAIAAVEDDEGRASRRPVLSSTGTPLADIAWSLEEAPMPKQLQERYPQMGQDDWDAFTRFATVLLNELVQPIGRE